MNRLIGALIATAALSSAMAQTPPARKGAGGAHTHTQGTGGQKGQPHEHTAPHGGRMQDTRTGHLEMVASRDGTFKLYVMDDQLKTLPVTGASATLKLTIPGYADVKLSPEGDHLAGKGAPFQAEHPTAVVSVTAGGTTQTARFSLHLEEGGHGFPSGGDYTLFADFTPKGSAQVVERLELAVAGKPQPRVALQADREPTQTVDGMRVTLTSSKPLRAGEDVVLQFAVADAKLGKPVTDLQPYLGAFAHFVILSEDSTDFLHAHPLEEPGTKGINPSQVSAHTRFPRAGLYKVWAQLQRQGKVATIPFVVRVAAPATTSPAPKAGGHETHGAASIPAGALQVKVSSAGYEPSHIPVHKGQPLELAFHREDANNCANRVVFPSFGLERELPVGQTVLVELTPRETGTLAFTCGMSMYRGTLVVQD